MGFDNLDDMLAKSQSPLIGSFLRIEAWPAHGVIHFDVSIPSDRVIPSDDAILNLDDREDMSQSPLIGSFLRITMQTEAAAFIQESQSPLIGSFLRIKSRRCQMFVLTGSQSPLIGSFLRI